MAAPVNIASLGLHLALRRSEIQPQDTVMMHHVDKGSMAWRSLHYLRVKLEDCRRRFKESARFLTKLVLRRRCGGASQASFDNLKL